MSRYKCPACGAALHIQGSSGEAVCDYCGCRTDIQPPKRKSGYDGKMKYCRHCGERIPEKAVVCTACGCQVEELKRAPEANPQVVIHHHSRAANQRDKWKAFALCLFLGWLGAHKFYEGKHFMGVVYLLTFAFGGIGWLVDCMVLLFKPNPYDV